MIKEELEMWLIPDEDEVGRAREKAYKEWAASVVDAFNEGASKATDLLIESIKEELWSKQKK